MKVGLRLPPDHSVCASSAKRRRRERRGRLLGRESLGVLAAAAVTMCCKRGSAPDERPSLRRAPVRVAAVAGAPLPSSPGRHWRHASFNPHPTAPPSPPASRRGAHRPYVERAGRSSRKQRPPHPHPSL
ncbi:hypothetical protein AAFF_G00092090 [Aldrovandia affinis]|uniref:Uncharacterized protein n=1 Tax=Aldrovandia affinis TaxID=143900 RepID=A0AAD7T2L5_9TELE|nr:hypothetical protein AAFF_G00092090 [Aldrovandia affinis]